MGRFLPLACTFREVCILVLGGDITSLGGVESLGTDQQ